MSDHACAADGSIAAHSYSMSCQELDFTRMHHQMFGNLSHPVDPYACVLLCMFTMLWTMPAVCRAVKLSCTLVGPVGYASTRIASRLTNVCMQCPVYDVVHSPDSCLLLSHSGSSIRALLRLCSCSASHTGTSTTCWGLNGPYLSCKRQHTTAGWHAHHPLHML